MHREERKKQIPPLRGPTRHKTARKKKSGCSGRDDNVGKEKRDGNTEVTEIGTQGAQREEGEGIVGRDRKNPAN